MSKLFDSDKSKRVKELKKRLRSKRFIDNLARRAVNNGGDYLSELCKLGFIKPDWEAIVDDNPKIEQEVIKAVNDKAMERIVAMKPVALMKAFETLISVLSGSDGVDPDELKSRVDAAKSVITATKNLGYIDGTDKNDEFNDEEEIKRILGMR